MQKGNIWPVVRLGDIARTTSGGTPRRDRPQFYGGSIPWVKSGELGDSVVYETDETITEEAIKSSNAKIFPKGTLCIALYGATVGKLGILGIAAATNQAVCAIFPPDELDTRYLYRFFESKRRELVEQGKGGAQPNISQGIIRDTKLPLPPLEEQRGIVAEIEKQFTRLEAGVSALRRVQANLKRYRAAVLKAACEGKLVGGALSKWEVARLGDLVTIRYGKMLPTKELSESGFPVFGANGIIGHHTRFLYTEEQVLISCRGAYSGKINLSPPHCYVTNNSLALEMPERPRVTKRFLFYALQAIDRSKMVTGSAQPQVTINNAEVAEIPVPPPAEQTRIVAEVERRLSVVQELESGVSVNLKRAIRLRQSVLRRAFEGKFTVGKVG